MEFLKEYDITILYHPRKSNMVADALSRMPASMGSLAYLNATRRSLAREIQSLANKFIQLEVTKRGGFLASIESRSIFFIKSRLNNFGILSYTRFVIRFSGVRLTWPLLMVIGCYRLRVSFCSSC